MPELPEVEYTARQLRTSIVGATISHVHVFGSVQLVIQNSPRF